jgi:type VI protein secretion system component Hcp
MPSDILINIAGINGESQQQGFTNYIELDSISWGAAAEVDISNKGMSAGKPHLQDLNMSFGVDSASFQIVQNITKGTHIANASFCGRKAGGGGTNYTYLIIVLTGVIIHSFTFGGGSSGAATCSLSLAYEQINYQYFTQDTSSGGVTLAGQATYNIATGVSS